MKKIIYTILLILGMSVFSGCEKEDLANATMVGNINISGVWTWAQEGERTDEVLIIENGVCRSGFVEGFADNGTEGILVKDGYLWCDISEFDDWFSEPISIYENECFWDGDKITVVSKNQLRFSFGDDYYRVPKGFKGEHDENYKEPRR